MGGLGAAFLWNGRAGALRLRACGMAAEGEKEAAEPELEPEVEAAGEEALVPRPPATPKGAATPGEEGDGADPGKLAQESPAQPVAAALGSSKEGRLSDGTVLQNMKQYNKDMKKVALLRNVPFCKELSDNLILTLAKKMKRVTVRTGRTGIDRSSARAIGLTDT